MKKLATLALLLCATSASADPLHADVEIDPTAYALDGDSVHVGVGTGRFRFDLGSFAERLPQAFHGHDGFDVSFAGFGVKAQAFLAEDQRGWFGGVDGGVLRVLAQRHGSDLADRQRQVSVGIHAGYRFVLPDGFYITPWIGVGYSFGARDVTLDGATYHADPISVFPAVHLGFRFR
ncbi:MAG TPA: hypothetical protein VIV58_34425 [Kofleriaceae bacterium]